MSYHFEIWLRGYAKDFLRTISSPDKENYHPHITFVRPFRTKYEGDVKRMVTEFCSGRAPIPFTLAGVDNFDRKVDYVKVTNESELLFFDSQIERLLDSTVDFAPKLSPEKILHATYYPANKIPDVKEINQYMLRLTGIKDKKIWFTYDFVRDKVLDRGESLDKSLWYGTVHMFSEKTGLLPTKNGFKEIHR